MTRRQILSNMARFSAATLFAPLFFKFSGMDVDEFVIVDGWVLRADDFTKRR